MPIVELYLAFYVFLDYFASPVIDFDGQQLLGGQEMWVNQWTNICLFIDSSSKMISKILKIIFMYYLWYN